MDLAYDSGHDAAAADQEALAVNPPAGTIPAPALDIPPLGNTTKTREEVVAEIARKELRIPTLEHRKSDRLDFHTVSVWGVQQALEAAYEAGQATNRPAAVEEAVTL